jgi:hypothetical protein
MSTLNVKITPIEITYHNSQFINRQEDVFHNVDALASVEINGSSFDIMYQCGMSFTANDYNRPSTNLAVSDNSTDELIQKMDQLTESCIESFDNDDIAEYTEMCSDLKSIADLLVLHHALNEALIEAKSDFEVYKNDSGLSDDAGMYIEDEGEVYIRLINA